MRGLIDHAAALRGEAVDRDEKLREAEIKESSLCDQLVAKLAALEKAEGACRGARALLNEEREESRRLEHELAVAKEAVERGIKDKGLLEAEQESCRRLEREVLNLWAKANNLQVWNNDDEKDESERARNRRLEHELVHLREKVLDLAQHPTLLEQTWAALAGKTANLEWYHRSN